MKRDGENVAGVGAPQLGLRMQGRRPARGQRLSGNAHAREDGRGSVSLVNVAIYGHGAGDLVVTLHAANRNRDIVNHAEAFAVIGEGMVKTSGNIESNPVVERVIGSKDRSART